jgi:UDP-glucose 4-epimerase
LKRVLITGANSYVGTNVEKWLMKEPDNFYVETLDMRDPNWKNFDFSKFDVVFHVAGIAHVKETKKTKELYYKINRDLAVETAIKAKESGVNHFIFISSMSVYGKKRGLIDSKTQTKPVTHYGISKLEAENELLKINMSISILRPPVIYGHNAPGNFNKLIILSKFYRINPKITNRRSMLFIGNFCHQVKTIINDSITGIVYPQNDFYFCTSDLIPKLRNILGKKTFNLWIPRFFSVLFSYIPYVSKPYGSLYYDFDVFSKSNCIFNEDDTIQLTLSGKNL